MRCEIFDQISEYYQPESADGVLIRHRMALAVTVIAERDATYPLVGTSQLGASDD